MVEDVIDLFSRQAKKCHSVAAVKCDEGMLSYGMLDAVSSQLASSIESAGFDSSAAVAYEPERSCWDVAAYLGVLRSGRSFLPIDPSQPLLRRNQILEDARPVAFLKRCSEVFELVRQSASVAGNSAGNSGSPSTEAGGTCKARRFDRSLAYILYTSGSTGSPKGVAMGREALSYLVAWQSAQDGPEATLTTAHFAPMTFDVAYQELLSTLCFGGTLVIVSEEARRDPAKLLCQLQRQSVGRLFIPTSVLPVVAREAVRGGADLQLRSVYVAGERLKITPTIRRWFAGMRECRLHNHYGPTETHVVCAHKLDINVEDWEDLPPIGRPLPHVKISVRDESGMLAAEGDAGELWIAGPALSEGYVGDPTRSTRSFPVTREGRFYRTGDSVRWRNGHLEFCGRIDRQIKINGYRVEPAEVEAVLATHADIDTVVVTIERTDSDVSRLVAYVVPTRHDLLPPEAERADRHLTAKWRAYAVERLPSFMVPSAWVLMRTLPLTGNGKVDLRSLPKPSAHASIHT